MSTNRSRALRWGRSRRIVAAIVLALSLLPTALLAAPPTAAGEPQPAPRGEAALTRGAWVGRTAAGSTAFRLVLDGAQLSGHSYLLRDGKAISEVPVAEATLETAEPTAAAGDAAVVDREPARELEIRLANGWTYRGRLDVDGTRLDGDLDLGGGRRQALALDRVAPESVPGLLARAPGEPAWADHRPAQTGDGWATASVAETGLDPAQIAALVGEVAAGDAGLIHSLLLVHGGRLAVEEYFHGFGRDDLHAIHSCTKSVASLLVGLAIERGELAGVDTPVLGLFPELAEAAAPGWDALQVRHLLTMTSGTEWRRRGPPPAGPALLRAALAHPPAAPPGDRWHYSDLDADLLAVVLQRATGVQADAYAARYLFAPLAISGWDWEAGKIDGFPRLYGNLRLRPRDMAKLGQLVLGGGVWKGRQVVPAAWIHESTRQQVEADGAGYGYLWWREPVPPAFPSEVISARGVGSQLVYVAPELDLVAVVTGGNQLNDRMFDIGRLLVQHLAPPVPAVGGGASALF